jgi:putative hydrolase of the HAD superfamily
MLKAAFDHVETWVFDLDHTLYPPSAQLFPLIEARMITWVKQAIGVDETEANRLRKHYWQTYGTTLAGLMREHDLDPDPFLHDVHDIAMDSLTPDPELAKAIKALPGRRIIYTNGTAPYARRVIKARGLDGLFDAIYGVEHAAYHPKPDHAAFEKVFGIDGLNPAKSAMFEDEPRNLTVPHAMGMATVHVAPLRLDAAHIHHHTDDLGGFLTRLCD